MRQKKAKNRNQGAMFLKTCTEQAKATSSYSQWCISFHLPLLWLHIFARLFVKGFLPDIIIAGNRLGVDINPIYSN